MCQSNNVVLKSLYRSLLRHARKIDKNLALKFLVVAKPKVIFDRERDLPIHFSFDTNDLNNFIERFTGGGQFYRPESSITQLLRNAFQKDENVIMDTELFSTAFSALRLLADVNDMSQHLPTNWSTTQPVLEEPPSKNQLKQITDFSSVESFTGRLLITHPVSCIDQKEFHRAVILLHEDKKWDAVTGYIINKPKKHLKLGEVLRDVVPSFPELVECEVWDAGVMEGFAFLHTCPEIKGSVEVDVGVYIHPITYANDRLRIDDTLKQLEKAVVEKRTDVENIKFLRGICCWKRKQLLCELERTVWFITDSPPEGIKAHLKNNRPNSLNLWQSLLSRFGGEYEQIAATPEYPRQILQWLSQAQKNAFYDVLKDTDP